MKNHYCIKGLLLTVFLLLPVCILKGQSPLMESVSQERTDIWKDFGIRGNFLGVSADGSIFTWFIDGINRSQDEGASWEVVLGEVGEDFSTFAFDINEDNRVFVFCLESQTVFYSDDNGDSWQQTSPVPQVLSSNNPADLWSPTNDIIVGLDRTQSGNALFWTVDGGATWDFSVLDFGCEGGVVNDVLVNAQGDVYVAFSNDGLCQNEGIFHSTLSDMQNWTFVAFDHAAVRQLLFHPDGSIVAGNFGGSMSGFHHEPGFYLFDAMADEVAISDNGVVYRLQFHQEWGPTGIARLAFSTDHGEHFYEIGQGIYAEYIYEDMRDGSLFKGRDNYLYVCSQARHKKSVITADEIPSIPMILTWTDIVTEQPEGYVVDANGDAHIYSAEGLAWLSVLSNGLHGQEADNFEGKTITLEAEVDMSRAIWTSICANESSFKGSFNGKEYVINGLQMKKTNGLRTGFFGSLSNAALSNIVIRNGYFDGIGYGMGFLASQATKCLIDHCFVECEMHGGECAPFVFSNIGSTITNSMVYSPFMRNEVDYWAWGGVFVAENRQYNGDLTLPQIINCAAVIKYMNWSEQCGFVGEYNHGLIENCYAYIDELLDCPGWAPGNPPRNGITRDNSGEIINCYYNSPLRIRDVYEGTLVEIPLIDVPCGNNTGTLQDAISFDRDVSGSWRLTHPISFNLGSGTVSTDVLLDALNNKLNELNNGNLLDWCDTVTGFDNQQLPVFCGIDIVEINEHQTDDNQVVLFPNPSDGNIRIEGVEVVELQVFNTLGQLVKAYNNTNEIFLGNLPNGLYLIRIIDHKGDLITKKILVI